MGKVINTFMKFPKMSNSGGPWNQGHVYEIRGIPMKSGASRCPWFQGQSTGHQGVPDFRGSLEVNMVSLISGAVTTIHRVSLHSGAVLNALSASLPQQLDCLDCLECFNSLTALTAWLSRLPWMFWQLDHLIALTAWQLDCLDSLSALTAWVPLQLDCLHSCPES